jgi:8-oxo-dGTP pyrophosphatase MutT (NUDIX family)
VGDKRISVAAAIRDDAGRILLVKQTYGRLNWELPGGKVEPNEEVTAAVVREVREETGLDVAADRVTGLYDEQDENFLHLVFACH